MSALQKQAWFNLIVIAMAAATVLALYPWLGVRASGGFGILGLIAMGAIFHSRRGRRVVWDERDTIINQRANIIAYTVLWLAFVTAACLAPLWFGDAVPTVIVQNSVWVAFMVLYASQSIAALAQYRQGGSNAE